VQSHSVKMEKSELTPKQISSVPCRYQEELCAEFRGSTLKTSRRPEVCRCRSRREEIAFRRFRTTYLRKQRAPEGLVQFWLGHAGKSITDGYGRSLWQRRYGGEKSIIGRGLPLDGVNTTVLGVMPKEFFFRERDVDYWVPFHYTVEQRARRRSHFLTVAARTKPGIGLQLAQKGMDRVSPELQVQYPENAQLGANVVTIQVGLRRRCASRLVSGCRSLRY
jgi:hypothetical protein